MLADGERGQAWVDLTELHSRTNVFVVLVPPLATLRVGCQVGIDHADVGVVKPEPDGHAPLLPCEREPRKGTVPNFTVIVIQTRGLSKCSLLVSLCHNPGR